MKISLFTKLIGGFLLVAVLSSALGVLALVQMNTINQNAVILGRRDKSSIYQIGEIKLAIGHYRRHQILFVAAVTDATKKDAEDTINSDDALIKKDLSDYQSQNLVYNSDEQTIIDNVSALWNQYLQQSQGFLALSKAGKNADAIGVLTGDADGTFDKVMAATENWDTFNQNLADKLLQNDETTDRTAVILVVCGILLAAALAVILGLAISRPLSRDARTLELMADQIAQGELDQITVIKREDEIGEIGKAFGRMTAYLQGMAEVAEKIAQGDLAISVTPQSDKDVLGNAFSKMITELNMLVGQVKANSLEVGAAAKQVNRSVDQAAQATSQIASTMQQMSNGINEQAEVIGQTAQSVDQMSQVIMNVAGGSEQQASAVRAAAQITSGININIHQVTSSAQAGAETANSAADTARTSARTIEETIQGMKSIKAKVDLSVKKVQEMGTRSNQIGAIVETIEDIASQTNLLALNAAIEAARAGEHGKGFAVVADEVRKLAERASSATKEINSLVKGIQLTVGESVTAMNEGAKEVELGVERASQSGLALESILKAVEAISRQANEIANAAHFINTSSGELVTSVDSVSNSVAENNAAMLEISSKSNEVAKSIEAFASMSSENSAAIEEVSASTEEMSAQFGEVRSSVQQLADMAQNLQALIARFKVEQNQAANSAAAASSDVSGNGHKKLEKFAVQHSY
ncbi:MAG: methyl-accepting chemotaxis protein [Anaerolineaceae bacterium]|nr:methyl-accepting chemotaxis protein [Anaerolineaceae bacterium]